MNNGRSVFGAPNNLKFFAPSNQIVYAHMLEDRAEGLKLRDSRIRVKGPHNHPLKIKNGLLFPFFYIVLLKKCNLTKRGKLPR